MRRGFADAAAFGLVFAGVHQSAEERAGRDDDGATGEARAVGERDSCNVTATRG